MATKKDFSQTAFAVFQQSTGEVVPDPVDPKKKAAQESGRRGGVIGGAARAKKLSSVEKSLIARKGAKARWAK